MSGTRPRSSPADAIPRPKPRWRKLLSPWNLIGTLLLCAAVAVSLWQVNQVEKSQYRSDIAVVRISHWQLELGFRNALQLVIDDYNAMMAERFKRGEIPKRVLVEQLPVSEKAYGQLINTNLISGTAPDLVEMGMTNMINGAYRAQFFVSLSNEIERPNPYNAPPYQAPGLSAELARKLPGMPWRETFLDGMSGGFDKDLQSYYSIPITFAPSGRLAVNLDLLQAATGSDELPKTLGQLLATCDKLRAFGKRNGQDIWPIAGSSYSTGFFSGYITPFLAASQRVLDADHDGSVTLHEMLTGVRLGTWSFDIPAFGDMVDATRAVASRFPNGVLGMDREGAMLMFTQRQSGFLYCGAWDAGTVYRLTAGKFRVGIMTDVLPGPGEPWGPVDGVNEATMSAGGSFGVNRSSPNLAFALDFIRFLTSQAQNQRFNNEANWVPCIVGSKLPKPMITYAPAIAGHFKDSAWLFDESEQLTNIFNGKMQSVVTGRATREEVIATLKEAVANPDYGGEAVIAKKDEDLRTNERNIERGLAAQSLAQLLAPSTATSTANYVTMLSTQVGLLNGRSALASRRCAEEARK